MEIIEESPQTRCYELAWGIVEEAALVPSIALVPCIILTVGHLAKLYPAMPGTVA